MKKLIVTLVLALFAFSMTTGAWAASSADGSSCTGNNILSKPGSASLQNGSGSDANSLFDAMDSFGSSNGTVKSSQDCSGTNFAKVPSGCTSPEDLFNSFCSGNQDASTGNTGCADGKTTAAPSVKVSAAPSAKPASGVTQGEVQAAKETADAQEILAQQAVTAAEETTPATCNDNSCALSDECLQTNCDEAGNECNTGDCTTNSQCGNTSDTDQSASGNKVYDFLKSTLEKCGIKAEMFSVLNNSCAASPEVTAPGNQPEEPTPVPSDNGTETPVPSDNGTETPVSTDNGGETAPPDDNADNQSFEQQVVNLVNEQREANGLAPLTLNAELSNVARAKSQDMHDKNYFSHTSPTYGSPFDMLKTFGIGYNAAGENIAMGYATPEAVVNGWMNSPGHRANILNSSYTQIGVGYVADGNYWTQLFIG